MSPKRAAAAFLISLAACLFAFWTTAGASPQRSDNCRFDQPAGSQDLFADNEDRECFRSPDRKALVEVRRGEIQLLRQRRSETVGKMDGGRIVWRPRSDGFVVEDQEGSGETARVRYVDISGARPRVTFALAQAGVRRFKAAFQCRGSKFYANTIIDGFDASGAVRLVVQEGIHSEGCQVPGGTIGVIGDPVTGRVEHVLSDTEIGQSWCTSAQRRQSGYCYDETLRPPRQAKP
jgi:hypothetical protein